MSAENLRSAAALMRERSQGATSGPWQIGAEPDDATSLTLIYSAEIATRYATTSPNVARVLTPQSSPYREAKWGETTDAAHIASWSPEVAEIVAAALEESAEQGGHHPDESCCALCDIADAYLSGSA